MDGDTYELLDILENRRFPCLECYFMRFSSEVREAIKLMCAPLMFP